MTLENHPTDVMDNPDGIDAHYRFQANDEEAWKLLRIANLKGRLLDMYPKDMDHLRVQIDHVTFKTHDHMGYIKGMKKYSVSPDWEVIPFSHGRKEMKHAHGGGSKIRAKRRVSEKWGEVTVEYHVEATPGEIKKAFNSGVNESKISNQIQNAQHWAIEDKLEELREKKAEYQRECDHDHFVIEDVVWRNEGYCEDCGLTCHNEMEVQATIDSGATVVG